MIGPLDRSLSRRGLLRGTVATLAGAGLVGLTGVRPGVALAAATPRSLAQPMPPRWTLLDAASGPSGRSDLSLTLDPDLGRVYLFGGRNAVGTLGDLWRFDVASGTWSELGAPEPRPAPRFGHNAFWDPLGQRLVVALGQMAPDVFFDDVWAFDPSSGLWATLGGASPERPQPRYGSAGAFDPAGNRFLVSHGFTNLGRFDDTWSFDLAGDAWSPVPVSGERPEPRCLVRGAWDATAGQLALFGGQSNRAPFLGDFWTLDLASGVWVERTSPLLPSARNFYGASYDPLARRWYLCGGKTADGASDEVWAYDFAAEAWSPVPVDPSAGGPSARRSLDLSGHGPTLYLFGGNDGSGDQADVWLLDLMNVLEL